MRSIPNYLAHLFVNFYLNNFMLKIYILLNIFFDFTSKSMFDKLNKVISVRDNIIQIKHNCQKIECIFIQKVECKGLELQYLIYIRRQNQNEKCIIC